MKITKEAITIEIEKILPEIIEYRRRMHEYPCLSEEEGPACDMTAEVLAGHGIKCERLLDGTALCAVVGSGSAPAVAIRADIDALPLSETTGLPFASRAGGVMHACGHDIHAACALGAAIVLKKLEGSFRGSVKVMFQPAEETIGGARRMIEAGVLDSPRVSGVIGLHVLPSLPAGKVSFKYGKMHASSDEFSVIFHGRGCHGASPSEGCDAVLMASQFVVAVQQAVSRNVAPVESAVVTVGSIYGGSKGNIIAESVQVCGIIRTLDEETRMLLRRRVEEIAGGTALCCGGTAEFILRPSYRALINDNPATACVEAAARELLGAKNVVIKNIPSMGAEDFAYFAAARPSCFYELGCGFPGREKMCSLHSPGFEADENCIAAGILLQAGGALALLES